MKKNNRKGFTIVELVIVIAVIGILAGVMIPTFGGVVAKANEAAADQEAQGILTQYLNENATTLTTDVNGKIVVTKGTSTYTYLVEDNNITNISETNLGASVSAGTGKCFAKDATDGIFMTGTHAATDCTHCN